jgi:hypothetical protein
MVNQIILEVGGMMKETLTSSLFNEEYKYLQKTFKDKFAREVFIERVDSKKNKIIITVSNLKLYDELIKDMRGKGMKLALKSFRMMGVKMLFIRDGKEFKI